MTVLVIDVLHSTRLGFSGTPSLTRLKVDLGSHPVVMQPHPTYTRLCRNVAPKPKSGGFEPCGHALGLAYEWPSFQSRRGKQKWRSVWPHAGQEATAKECRSTLESKDKLWPQPARRWDCGLLTTCAQLCLRPEWAKTRFPQVSGEEPGPGDT